MKNNGSILVVDDEEIMREILETLLKGEGYAVRLAASGEEGIELARNIPFDAAIVDVMMPGINGMTTLESLKKLDDELAVIMVTAFASVENAITARSEERRVGKECRSRRARDDERKKMDGRQGA